MKQNWIFQRSGGGGGGGEIQIKDHSVGGVWIFDINFRLLEQQAPVLQKLSR